MPPRLSNLEFEMKQVLGALILLAGMTWLSLAQAAAASAAEGSVQLKWTQIPLRDGVHLGATVYLPKSQAAPSPCVFTLTPYGSDSAERDPGLHFAAHGVPFLTVDTRGRNDSQGEFTPFIQEAHDGYDVVEWIAKQPYCNGKVAMWGGSYAGYDQWAVAKEMPPHLATIVPAAAAMPGMTVMSYNGVFRPGEMQWLTLTSHRSSQWSIYDDHSFWTGVYVELFKTGVPFRQLDRLSGNFDSVFQQWIQHPHPDAYWDRFNPTPEQYARLSIPILTVTGSNDGEQPGALGFYRQHMRYGSAEAKPRHYLVIGPWNHAGTRIPTADVDGVTFGPASLVDLFELETQWYAWTMRGGPRPAFLKDRVAYYVMGAETWRYADSLDAVTAESRPYFLDSTGNPTDVLASGSLEPAPPVRSGQDHYIYEPRDTSSAELEAAQSPGSLIDQRFAYASRGKALVYHSAPFDKDTEVSGSLKLSLWLAIDQPDTDFSVSVYEIRPDGSSIRLGADWMRARYRQGLREEHLIRTQEPLRYDFEHFTFVSRRIGKGSRLRLIIGPLNSISFEKNYNTGGVVADESMKDARPVHVTLYHDKAHPSALYVPIGRAESPP
jgi:uncharacterized protein